MTGERTTRADALRSREVLLDAGAAVLAQRPDPTLADIAEAAGVSRATAYRHFSDVEAVRAALLAEAAELGRVGLQQHLFPDGKMWDETKACSDQITRILRAVLPIESRYSRALVTEPIPDAGLIAAFMPVTVGIVKQGQARSEFRADLDPELMATAMITLALDAARRLHRDGTGIDHALQIIGTFVRGMETSPRTARGARAD